MMKSKPKLLMLMFFLHVYKTSPAASSIDASEVKSFVLERKDRFGNDYFTVNMKSKRADGTAGSWCKSLEALQDTTKAWNHSSFSCFCFPPRYSFITPMQKCINKSTAAAIFEGCKNYFNRLTLLEQPPVDLTKKSRNYLFLRVNTAANDYWNLFGNNTYFSYSGFQCKWETIDDGFFFLNKQGYVSWEKNDTLSPKLSGRIIRLVVKYSSTNRTRCVLFKSLGKVTYYGPVHSSTSSGHPCLVTSSSSSSLSLSPPTSPPPTSPPPVPSPCSSSSSESSPPSTLLSSTSSSAPPMLSSSSASSALSPSPSLMLSSSTGTLGVPQSISSFLPSTQSEITRLPSLNTGQILSTSKAGLQSLLPIKSDDATDIPVSTGTPYHSTNTVIYPIEPSKTTKEVSSSSAAGVVPGNSGTRTGGNDNGVIIGTAVGGAVILGIFIIIIIVFWKRRKAWESTEKQTKPVKNPVYGSSENAIQLEAPKGSKTMPSITQDNQPTYQSLIDDNGPSNGAAIYSSADDEYDNCTVYQSLDKQIPGTPVYGRLNKGLPEPAHTTGLPKPKPKAKTNAGGIPTSKANGVTVLPKPTTTGKPSNRPIVAHENVYNVLDGPVTGEGTTPEPLYNVLEGTDSGQDYEAPTVDPLYNVLEVPDPRQDTPNNGPSTTQDPLYNVLEGPDAKNATSDRQDPGNDPLYNVLEGPEASHVAYESGAHTAQEPLYNVLDGPDAEKSPVVTQGTTGPSNEPLYNVLDGPDSDGSKQGAPKEPISPEAHDNPAYEQTLAFDAPYAAVHKPGMQRESVYEPLRGPGQDLYESIGQSDNPHSAC